MMTSNLSLRTTVLVIAILFSGILIPYTAFASPIFETDSAETGNSYFETEQSITNPLYFHWTPDNEPSKVSNLDVVVYDETETFVIFTDFSNANGNRNIFLSFTNSSIANVTNGFFVDLHNSTQTVMLNENGFDVETFIGSGIQVDANLCHEATEPKISVTDTHVFVIWRDNDQSASCGSTGSVNSIAAVAIPKSSFADISSTAFFNTFTTRPAYFSSGTSLPTSTTLSLAANGTNAFITWENTTSVNFIPFSGTTYVTGGDTGAGFGTDIKLDDSPSANNPDVVADGTNVFVAWENSADKNIKLKTSSNSGVSFDATATDISGTASELSTNPKLAEDDGIVHISWLEDVSGAQQLFVASSGNSYLPVGVSTVSGSSTATSHQIIAAGASVFTVWEDNIDGGPVNEVLFSNSTNYGKTFGTPINLSNSTGDSVLPQISGNSTNVNIVWRDNTFLPLVISSNAGEDTDGQVWFKSYNVTSKSASGLQVISEATNKTKNTFYSDIKNTFVSYPAPIPKISSFAGVVIAVWNPNPTRASGDFGLSTWEGSMKVALTSNVDISFDRTEYLDPRNATITVVDTSKSDTVNIDLRHREGPFVEYTLVEEGSTGIFSNTFALFNSTFGGTTGDIFTANYTTSGSSITTQAKLQETRILDFLTEGNSTGIFFHDIGDVVGLKLIDAGSNTTAAADTIDVTITSAANPTGVTLTLTETGLTTGIFNITNALIFMDGAVTPSVGDALTITQTWPPGNTTTAVDTITRHVNTTSTPAGVDITLTETGGKTAVFTGQISICSSSDPLCISPNIFAVGGDFIRIASPGGSFVTNGIVLPDNVDERAAIQVSCTNNDCGEVTATYNGLSVSIDVGVTTAGGGGGGGVSRAGLVVNALAGLSSSVSLTGGGGADGSSPITSLGSLVSNKNFNIPDEVAKIVENYDPNVPLESIPSDKYENFDLPLTINGNGYPLAGYSNTIETFSTTIGDPITITSLFYEQTVIQHVSMYMNLRGIISGDLSQSDTQILYNKNKPLQIIDPNGFFESVSVNIIEDEETIKKFVEFEIVFAKYLEKSDIVLRSWDDRLRSSDTIIYDAIEIVDPASIVETVDPEPTEEITEVTEVQKVPDWIKNNAEWWSQGEVDDTTFKNAIGFLIEKQIIDMPTGPNVSVSTEGLSVDEIRALEEEAQRVTPIPDWIKNTAEWWYLGDVTEDEFLMSIEYLVKNGIIEI